MPIGPLVSSTHILKLGDQGPSVIAVQLALKRIGFALSGSGYFGPGTDTAVSAFQKRVGLPADGEVGPRTAAAIDLEMGKLNRSGATQLPLVGTAPQEISRPLWLEAGIKLIGTKERIGGKSNPEIIDWALEEGGETAKEYTDTATPWCFTGETEVMAERGFVRFDEIKEGERVYQADETGVLSLSPCIRVEKDYEGDVFDIKHASVRLTCDINHRWFGLWDKRNPWLRFDTLENLTTAGLRIPTVVGSGTGVNLTDSQLALLAAFISDGKNRDADSGKPWSIEFEVSRLRKVSALMAMQPAHVYQQKKAYGPLTKVPLTVFRFEVPSFFSGVFERYKVLAREFVNSLSPEQCRTFLTAYAEFDGNGKTEVYSSSPNMRDDLLVMAVMAGYRPSVVERKSPLSSRPSWTIKFGDTGLMRMLKPEHLTRRYFNGKLYCVSVPHGRVVVRGENKTPVLTGNCALGVDHCFSMVGMKGTGTLWALDYANWGIGLPGPAVGAVAPMKRSGGGHVTIVAGRDAHGNLMCLGFNQGDTVSIIPFPKTRPVAFRWPKTAPLPSQIGFNTLPLVNSEGTVSTKET